MIHAILEVLQVVAPVYGLAAIWLAAVTYAIGLWGRHHER